MAAYFIAKTVGESSDSASTSTNSSNQGGKSSRESNFEGATSEEKKDAAKNDKKPENKPATGNKPSQSQTGGGGESSSGSTGGGGGTTPPQATLMGWQLTSQNTGLAPHGLSCDSLPLYTGSTKPVAGTTISQKRIQSGLDLSDGNITIEKSCIRPPSAGLGLPILTTTDYNDCNPDCAVAPNPITIRDSEIDGSLLSAQQSAYATAFIGVGSFYRNYIHGLGSGIAIMNAGLSASVTVEGNFVTGLTSYGDPGTTGNHSDAFTIRDFITTSNPNRRAIIKNNRFDCNSGNDTGAIFIQQTWNDNIDHVSIEGNLLEGGGYQLQLEGNTYGTHMSAVNNRFSGTGYGSAAMGGSGPGWGTWANNYINNPSAANNQGSVVSEP